MGNQGGKQAFGQEWQILRKHVEWGSNGISRVVRNLVSESQGDLVEAMRLDVISEKKVENESKSESSKVKETALDSIVTTEAK